MKTNVLSFRSCRWLLAFELLLRVNHSLSASPEDQPVITSIRLERTKVVVTAQVPDGIRRVTLECRSRLGAGSWEPRAVTRLDGSGGPVAFRIPKAVGLEMLRVRADDREPLPGSFYSGTNSFAGQPVSSGGLPGVDRKSTRLNSSHANISYAVFCLKKKRERVYIQSMPRLTNL